MQVTNVAIGNVTGGGPTVPLHVPTFALLVDLWSGTREVDDMIQYCSDNVTAFRLRH